MQLDHIFAFIDPAGSAIADLEARGLAVSYRRDHIGQGTANACFVFDNAFLELLWLTSETEARSPAIARTKLWERSQWQTMNTCPYGIAWRGGDQEIEIWPFAPPYLPNGVHIPVACDSDDPHLPMMFTFPGSTAPHDCPASKRVFPPHPGGWTMIEAVELYAPEQSEESLALQSLVETMEPRLTIHVSSHYRSRVTLLGPDKSRLILDF
jgi:hypothetical protein